MEAIELRRRVREAVSGWDEPRTHAGGRVPLNTNRRLMLRVAESYSSKGWIVRMVSKENVLMYFSRR